MENLEMMEINVEDLIDENVTDETMIESSFVDVPADVDIINNSSAKRVAGTNNGQYSEIGYYSDIPDSASSSQSSSIVPLCITIVVCLAIGIVLGIFVAKKTANK